MLTANYGSIEMALEGTSAMFTAQPATLQPFPAFDDKGLQIGAAVIAGWLPRCMLSGLLPPA